ncbi:MAG: MFS transporter [Alphaproteobacteria bacterium]|nr:MFS transporter [Alphaproteobacteria bacterium]
MPWALIAAACLGSFAASCSGTTRAPFLIAMSHDLGVSMPLVANIVSMTSIAWGIASPAAGYLSDLFGRRVLLVAGLCMLCLVMYAQAQAATFLWVAAFATLAGAASGTFTGVIYAEVSSRVDDRQRGRALGWVMSGQSLALVVGVPAAAWVGSMIGWRGWNVCVSVIALGAALCLLLATMGRGRDGAAKPGKRPSLAAALSPRIRVLLGVGVADRVCYGLAAVYFATFLQAIYRLTLAEIAIPLAVFALGNILGTILGGQLADRMRDRPAIVAVAMGLSGAVSLGLFMWHPSPVVSVALGFLYVMMNALGRPAYMALLAAVPEQVRGTVLGINGTSASVGWVVAAALGATVLNSFGFEGFGPLGTVLALLGCAGALVCRRMSAAG